MDWTWRVNAHDKYGDIIEEGVFVEVNETAALHFEDPTELLRFVESVEKSMDEIIEAWNNASVDE